MTAPMFLRNSIVLIFLYCLAFSTLAQPVDGLLPMAENPNIELKGSHQRANEISYALDTLHLPFIDDFSKNFLKQYTGDTSQAGTFVRVKANFIVDNQFFWDTLGAMFDTSYLFFYDSTAMQWDSIANPPLRVDVYNGFIDEPAVFTDTVWIVPEDGILQGDSLVPANPDTIWYNYLDSIFFIPDDGYSLWTDNDVYVNNTYSEQAITIGMATMDGLDSLGYPYESNLSSQNDYGLADFLTSKPLFLKTKPQGAGFYTVADSIYLSFYYQGKGLGEEPEFEDSLILELYSPLTQEWNSVWNTEGRAMDKFEQVLFKIQDTLYLQDGFRFRFKNYATVTGNFDHWHIDYVRVEPGRNLADTTVDDVAWTRQAQSLINGYQVMPWDHFKADPGPWMSNTTTNISRNNSASAKNMVYYLRIIEDGSEIYNGSQILNPNLGSKDNEEVTLNHSFTFPITDTASRKTFRVQSLLNTSPDANANNDTAIFKQDFMTYYAWHDRSCEWAYYVEGFEANVAVKYILAKADTLRAINMYFPKTLENIVSRPFRLKVWSSLSPEVVIYESPNLSYPRYSPRNVFVDYVLDTALLVSDSIYIGFEQRTDRVIVGFDVNTNSREQYFYKSGGSWSNGSFDGSLFINPEFGDYYPYPLFVKNTIQNTQDLEVYPNPVNSQLVLKGAENETIQIIDLSGRVIESVYYRSGQSIGVSHLQNGVYLIHSEKGTSAKFIKH